VKTTRTRRSDRPRPRRATSPRRAHPPAHGPLQGPATPLLHIATGLLHFATVPLHFATLVLHPNRRAHSAVTPEADRTYARASQSACYTCAIIWDLHRIRAAVTAAKSTTNRTTPSSGPPATCSMALSQSDHPARAPAPLALLTFPFVALSLRRFFSLRASPTKLAHLPLQNRRNRCFEQCLTGWGVSLQKPGHLPPPMPDRRYCQKLWMAHL
jgi:hypothetical protein